MAKVKLNARRTLHSQLAKVTTRTIVNWENEKRPIMLLLQKYFTDKEIEEFIQFGKIEKQELIKEFDDDVKRILKNYHNAQILEEIELLKKQLINTED